MQTSKDREIVCWIAHMGVGWQSTSCAGSGWAAAGPTPGLNQLVSGDFWSWWQGSRWVWRGGPL
jgi:hypothetical protein